jgi:hypothetical protein
VNAILLTVAGYSKGIIFFCIAALFVAQLAIHRFDPFHPKSVTSECIQTVVASCARSDWLAIALALAALFVFTKQRIRSQIGQYFLLRTTYFYEDKLYDPLQEALRKGRLERLTYY